MTLEAKIQTKKLTIRYSDGVEGLKKITLDLYANQINVLFGPAGGGKSTLLRAFNRLNDLVDVEEMSGKILLDGEDIYAEDVDVVALRSVPAEENDVSRSSFSRGILCPCRKGQHRRDDKKDRCVSHGLTPPREIR